MKIATKTQPKSIASIVTASLAILSWATGAAPIQAAEQIDPPTKIVAYGDLNVETEAGAKVLYARLRNAATIVCAPLESRDLSRKTLWRNCFDNAVTTAVVQVNKTRVTALHNQTTGPGKGRPPALTSAF
jgi:UrcA family protein